MRTYECDECGAFFADCTCGEDAEFAKQERAGGMVQLFNDLEREREARRQSEQAKLDEIGETSMKMKVTGRGTFVEGVDDLGRVVLILDTLVRTATGETQSSTTGRRTLDRVGGPWKPCHFCTTFVITRNNKQMDRFLEMFNYDEDTGLYLVVKPQTSNVVRIDGDSYYDVPSGKANYDDLSRLLCGCEKYTDRYGRHNRKAKYDGTWTQIDRLAFPVLFICPGGDKPDKKRAEQERLSKNF